MRISDWSSDVCSSDLVIAMETDPPALVGLRDVSAERLRHDLVPEADADEHRPPLGLPQPLDEAHDPGQAIINPRRRPGDDIAILRLRHGRGLVSPHIIGCASLAFADPPPPPLRISPDPTP